MMLEYSRCQLGKKCIIKQMIIMYLENLHY